MTNWNAIRIGAKKYAEIMDLFEKVDVSTNEHFQKLFVGFYRVRRSKDKFLTPYFTLMQSLKGKDPSFEEILRKIYSFQERYEPSFASKMLATINPDMPVWDSFVLKHFGLTVKKRDFEICIKTYSQLIEKYKAREKSGEADKDVKEFDDNLPVYNYFSKNKKMDLMIWQTRD